MMFFKKKFGLTKREEEIHWLCPSNAVSEIVFGKSTPLFQNIQWEDGEPTYNEDIVNPQILDESERQYLSAVIRPFRDKVTYICKVDFVNFNNPEGCVYQHIVIGLNDNSPEVVLPLFKAGTMYKGMVAGHVYILEDLGL